MYVLFDSSHTGQPRALKCLNTVPHATIQNQFLYQILLTYLDTSIEEILILLIFKDELLSIC